MFIEEFGINTVGPIEAISARNLHNGRRFSPCVLNKLKDGLVKGDTQRNGMLLVDVTEHWVSIHGRGLFGVEIQSLCHLENKRRVGEVIRGGRSMAALVSGMGGESSGSWEDSECCASTNSMVKIVWYHWKGA